LRSFPLARALVAEAIGAFALVFAGCRRTRSSTWGSHRRPRCRSPNTRPGSTPAGFENVSVEFTHPVADEMYSAIIRAGKPVLVVH
jgi:hypothetical protein